MPIPNNSSGLPKRPTGIPSQPQQTGRVPNRPNSGRQAPSRPAPQQRPNPQQRQQPQQRSEPDDLPEIFETPDRGVSTHHSSEYDFKSAQMQDGARREAVSNPYDPEDDDTFTSLSVDDQYDDDNAEAERERERIARKRREAAKQAREEELNRYKPSESLDDFDDMVEPETELEPEPEPKVNSKAKQSRNKKGKRNQDVFIDEKKGKLQPFGNRPRKIKEGTFDDRKNLRKNAVIIQSIVIGLVILLVGLGVKNAIFPPNSLTIDEVATIAINTTGTTNYPMVRGEAYAQDFMKAYLTSDNAAASQVLGYFYNGNLAAGDNDNRNISSGFKQSVLFGPTVYSAKALSDYSASFTIGSLVKAVASDGSDVGADDEPRWMFFNVNVYYDVDTDRMYITPDSPSIIPTTDVGSIADVPAAAALGTGSSDDALATEVQPVVHGFIKAYLESSNNNYGSLEQYIISDAPSSLRTGLNNNYQFAGDSLQNAVQYAAYPTANVNEAKILMKVSWVTSLGGSDSNVKATYSSTYVMTLEKQASKWLVSKFQPLLYAKDDKN